MAEHTHVLFTCPECGAQTMLDAAGGEVGACADACPNHQRNTPYPHHDLRYLVEVEVKGAARTTAFIGEEKPDPDGIFRSRHWSLGGGPEKVFMPGTGWVDVEEQEGAVSAT